MEKNLGLKSKQLFGYKMPRRTLCKLHEVLEQIGVYLPGEQVGDLSSSSSPSWVSNCLPSVPVESYDPGWPGGLCTFLLLLACRWPCKDWVCIYNLSDKAFCTSILFLAISLVAAERKRKNNTVPLVPYCIE